MSEIILVQPTADNHAVLIRENDSKDTRSRLSRFARWLDAEGLSWYTPELADYRDDLLCGHTDYDVPRKRGEAEVLIDIERAPMSPASVQAHLASIRGRYRSLVFSNSTRQKLFEQTDPNDPPERKKAFVDEVIVRMTNAINPENAKVKKVPKKQDRIDAEQLRLTSGQASALMQAPDITTVKGLRDTAIIALALCTGIREAELCALKVEDLRQTLDGKLSLHVREGKGCKERAVPYGDLDTALVFVDRWLAVAGITEGPVFRRVKRYGIVGDKRLSTRAVQYMLAEYPVSVDGVKCHVRPHDLRRTYARRQYDAGLSVEAIQQNLGHASATTTMGYIGTLDAEQRQAKAVYTFDLAALDNAPGVQTEMGV